MEFHIEVVVIADDGTERHKELVTLARTENEATLETIGLTLAESKQVLHGDRASSEQKTALRCSVW